MPRLDGGLCRRCLRLQGDLRLSGDKHPGGKQEHCEPPPLPLPQAATLCRRCGTPGPVGDDGFCEKCEKALEQACL